MQKDFITMCSTTKKTSSWTAS